MIRVLTSSFLTSASTLAQCPPPTTSEVVMLGRSNVGKSTLINYLLQANLAKSSSTPGKTRLINFFSSQWHNKQTNKYLHLCLIDLPGIGYAKVSKQEQEHWRYNLWNFLTKRTSIKLFLHLIDSRHTNMSIDMELTKSIKSILNADQRLLHIYTKADKLKKNDLAKLRQKKALIMANHDIISSKENLQKGQEEQSPKTLVEILRETIFEALLGEDIPYVSQNNQII